MSIRLTMGALFVILTTAVAQAAPLSTEFTYQGQLKDGGNPSNGVHDLRFRLYDTLSGGAQVGTTQCFNNVNASDGLFTVKLDFGAQFAGQQRFLEIDVRTDTGLDCANATGFTVLTPRQALTATPNALFAQSVSVPLTLTGTSNTHIIRAENASTGFLPMAIYGYCTGVSGGTTGVRGESASVNGRGVVGFATAASGTTYGGQFESTSPLGTGVWGTASATSGSAYGGRFESDSSGGRGVFGSANAGGGTNYGVYGQSASTNGRGVYGLASAATGTTFGVVGQVNSPDGFAGYFDGGRNYFEGSVGIGTSNPECKLHVAGGSDAEPGSGGYFIAGPTTSTNVVIDNNEVMARNNGAVAPLALNADGGNVNLIQAGTGNVGIGTSSPGAKLDVNGAARADSLEVNGGAFRVIGAGAGTNTAAFIHVHPGDGSIQNSNIDHPLCNGRSDALLFVTQRHSGVGPIQDSFTFQVVYNHPTWSIWGGEDLPSGARFNVLIVLP